MITQDDITTAGYFFLVFGGMVTSAGAIFIYQLFKSKKHDSK